MKREAFGKVSNLLMYDVYHKDGFDADYEYYEQFYTEDLFEFMNSFAESLGEDYLYDEYNLIVYNSFGQEFKLEKVQKD